MNITLNIKEVVKDQYMVVESNGNEFTIRTAGSRHLLLRVGKTTYAEQRLSPLGVGRLMMQGYFLVNDFIPRPGTPDMGKLEIRFLEGMTAKIMISRGFRISSLALKFVEKYFTDNMFKWSGMLSDDLAYHTPSATSVDTNGLSLSCGKLKFVLNTVEHELGYKAALYVDDNLVANYVSDDMDGIRDAMTLDVMYYIVARRPSNISSFLGKKKWETIDILGWLQEDVMRTVYNPVDPNKNLTIVK